MANFTKYVPWLSFLVLLMLRFTIAEVREPIQLQNDVQYRSFSPEVLEDASVNIEQRPKPTPPACALRPRLLYSLKRLAKNIEFTNCTVYNLGCPCRCPTVRPGCQCTDDCKKNHQNCCLGNMSILYLIADLETLIAVYEPKKSTTSIPVVVSTGGKKGESVVLWTKADVTKPRNSICLSVLRDLQREHDANEDKNGRYVEFDVGFGVDDGTRQIYSAQRFDVVDDTVGEMTAKVLVGGEFMLQAGILDLDDQIVSAVPKGMRVLVEQQSEAPATL